MQIVSATAEAAWRNQPGFLVSDLGTPEAPEVVHFKSGSFARRRVLIGDNPHDQPDPQRRR